jgi:hypothetical protein
VRVRRPAIREAQGNLIRHEVGGGSDKASEYNPDLTRFVASFSTAWRDGEVRPTHRKQSTGPRSWRTRVDPFEDVWSLVEQWLIEQPDATAKALFQRLQAQTSTLFAPGQLRTLQRRVKEWRTAIARQLVLGAGDSAEVPAGGCNSDPRAWLRSGSPGPPRNAIRLVAMTTPCAGVDRM